MSLQPCITCSQGIHRGKYSVCHSNPVSHVAMVSSMIEQLEWTTLQEQRKHSRLLMMYKLKNNIIRVDASSKLIPNERPSRNNNEQALHIPSCKTTARKNSFYPRTIKEWNTLPNSTVSAQSPESFKAQLRHQLK
jgi:hypothetical protein